MNCGDQMRRSGSKRARIELRSDEGDIAALRDQIELWLGHEAVGLSSRMDVLFVVSELITNAVEHGSDGPVTVATTRVDDDTIRLEVVNDAPAGAVPAPDRWKLPEPLATRGRGLGIVAALTSAADVVHADGLVHVTVEVKIGEGTPLD